MKGNLEVIFQSVHHSDEDGRPYDSYSAVICFQNSRHIHVYWIGEGRDVHVEREDEEECDCSQEQRDSAEEPNCFHRAYGDDGTSVTSSACFGRSHFTFRTSREGEPGDLVHGATPCDGSCHAHLTEANLPASVVQAVRDFLAAHCDADYLNTLFTKEHW